MNPAMDDDELLAEVRAAFSAVDPVPDRVLAAGEAAIAWRVPAAIPIELIADSRPATAGLRGGSRLLTFDGAGLTVEIEVTGAGRDRELAGRLRPPAPAQVRVRQPGGELRARADRTGHFVVPRVPTGLTSLVFRLPDATSIVTSWVRL